MDDLHCPDYFPRSIFNLIHFHPEWFDGNPGQPGPIIDELNRVYARLAITVLAKTLGAEAAREIGKTLDSAGELRTERFAVSA